MRQLKGTHTNDDLKEPTQMANFISTDAVGIQFPRANQCARGTSQRHRGTVAPWAAPGPRPPAPGPRRRPGWCSGARHPQPPLQAPLAHGHRQRRQCRQRRQRRQAHRHGRRHLCHGAGCDRPAAGRCMHARHVPARWRGALGPMCVFNGAKGADGRSGPGLIGRPALAPWRRAAFPSPQSRGGPREGRSGRLARNAVPSPG